MDENQFGLRKMPQLCAQCCALALVFWLPLYLNNGYVKLIAAKTTFVYLAVSLCCAAAVIEMLLSRSVPAAKLRTAGAAALLGWCAISIFSTVMARDRHTAVYGLNGRANGLLMLLACSAAFFVTVLFVEKKAADFLMNGFLLSACLVSVIGWLNYFGCDPLDVYYSIQPEQRHMFLSTIGNINFFGTFAVMAAGVSIEKLMRAEEKRDTLLYGAASVLLCSALIPANSDAAWLALAAVCAAILCRKKLAGKCAARLFGMCALVCVCGLLAGVMIRLVPVIAPLRTISALIAKPAAAAAGGVLCAATAVLLYKKEKAVRFVRPAILVLLCVAVLAVFAVNVLDISLGAADGMLRFGPAWGSNRGYVWGRLLYVYGDELSPLQKLFGVGPDGVNALINPHYTDYIKAMNGSTFDSAHNEYLQCLLCSGAAGLLCCCAFWFCAVRRGRKNESAAAAALIGYCTASFFSINMPAVLVPAFVLAGLCYAGGDAEPEKKKTAAACAVLCALLCLFVIPEIL